MEMAGFSFRHLVFTGKNKQQNKMKENKVVFLRGQRVVLRPIEKEDLEKLVIWINDPEVTQFLSMNMPMTMLQEEQWYDNLSKRDRDIILGIEVDGKLIGTMGFHHIDWVHRTATTGALIGDKAYWGKGYGTDAKMILLNFGFNTLGLRKINSSVYEFNKRSLQYSLHCGYKIEGRKKAQHFVKGRYRDEILLGLFKRDWLPYWREYKKGLKKEGR